MLGGRRAPGSGGPGDGLDGVFDLFPKLTALLGRKGGVLSGGEQQQLAIARVLLARPRLLLMDEPTEGIQPSVILQIEDAVRKIKARGIAVLLVEQYLEFAWRLADAYAIMRKGAIVARGETGELRAEQVREHLTV
jgi:urea transport system ATP-binding protein